VSGIFRVLGRLFSTVGSGSGTFLNFTGTIGDFLVSLDNAIKKGDGLTKFFDGLGSVLAIPIKLLGILGKALLEVFGFKQKDPGGFSQSLGDLQNNLSPLAGTLDKLNGAWQSFLDLLQRIGTAMKPMIDTIVKLIGSIGSAMSDAFSTANIQSTLAVLQ